MEYILKVEPIASANFGGRERLRPASEVFGMLLDRVTYKYEVSSPFEVTSDLKCRVVIRRKGWGGHNGDQTLMM